MTPAHGKDKIPPAHGKDKIPPAHGKDKIPPVHGKDKIPPAHGNDKMPSANKGNEFHQSVAITVKTGEVNDLNQHVWTLQGETLVAFPRSDSVAPVTITVMVCRYPETLEKGKGDPIYLGIQNPERCLCCEDVGGQPTLKLKGQNIKELTDQDKPVKPFLFYRAKTGRTSTLESVAFPGWFIATSNGGKPIFLTSDLGKSHNTAFVLNIRD
ncbi:interleukin-36 gamma-like [Carlito syrichta]|uniref:Interleukin-1 n=1 Tax=Carlito syrichta TaxID=1868482 RepID=A0A1U7UEJ4_CARSF|nr:interleukin-36 gamma-like [Carlito syrichta]